MSKLNKLNNKQKSLNTFKVSSSTTTKSIVPIAKRGAISPKLYYTPEVYAHIQYIVEQCQKEVGWLGLVREEDGNFLVYKVYVPEQEVCATETDISAEAISDLAEEIFNDGDDLEHLYYWGHSHVNMGVTPSSQDETQIEEFLEHAPRFIRGIYNKRGEAKIDYYDRNTMLVHTNIDHGIQLSAEERARLDELLKDNVTEQKPVTYIGSSYSSRLTPTTKPDNKKQPAGRIEFDHRAKNGNDYQPYTDYVDADMFESIYGGYS